MPEPIDLIDLQAYFARIGYDGPREATLDVLSTLHRLHPLSIPFENLDPLAGRRVRVDVRSVEDKLVRHRRGGYCFEHNTLFANALTQLGFRITPMMGRVLWGRPSDTPAPPRTHMVLRVDLDDTAYMADVGFGSVTLTAPLRLEAGLAQKTPHGEFRLADASQDRLDLEVRSHDGWAKVYRFDNRPVEWVDYETSNWFTSTAPESIFLNHLIVCRVLESSRLTLLDRQLTERAPNGDLIDERTLDSVDALAACLDARFGLDTDGIDLAAVLARLSA